MTIETRSTIGLDDIVALEYECKNCKSKSVRLLDERHKIPAGCANCGHQWLADGSQEHQDLTLFLNVLKTFPRSSVNKHVMVKLELRPGPPTSEQPEKITTMQ